MGLDQFDPKPLRGGLGEHKPLATALVRMLELFFELVTVESKRDG